MIELAARVWNMSLEGTIQRLRREGFEISIDVADIKAYIENTVKYRIRMRDMWKQSRQNMLQHSAGVGALLQKLGLRVASDHSRWGQAGGQLVGCMSAWDIEKTMRPNSAYRDKKKSWRKSTRRPVFKGRGWGDVLVFPTFDLPQRIRGFLFVGREADPEKDFVFRLCYLENSGGHGWVDRRCSGVLTHPDVLTTDSEFIFATDDPAAVYRVQQQNFRLSSKPLPLVAYLDEHPHRPRKTWEMFHDRQLIFWALKDPIPAFRQAIENNGMVSTAGPETHDDHQTWAYLDRMSPTDLMARVHHSAVPWQRAVARYLAQCDDNDIEEFVSQLQMAEINVATTAEQLPRRARERLQQILFKDRTTKAVTMDQKQVVEKPGGWYLSTPRNGDELLVNAHIRIDYVVQHKRIRQTYYRGRVIWKGEELDFVCPKKEFDRNPFAWVEQFLLDQGKGMLQYAKHWSSKAVLLATQFHQPEFVMGADFVGYDVGSQKFMLPGYEIHLGGRIAEHTHGVASGPLPASSIGRPEVISPQELAEINHPTCWATVVSLLANILAPAFGEETQGIGFLGAGADSIGKDTCEAVGCITHRLRIRTRLEPLRDEEALHGWPIVVETAVGKKLASEWIDPDRRAAPHNCAMLLDWYTFHAKLLLGDWHLLRDPAAGSLGKDEIIALRRLVAAYLRDLMSRNLEMAAQGPGFGSWWAQVHADLLSFVKRHHGDTAALRASEAVYAPTDKMSQANAFADLTGELLRTSRFVLVPEGFEDESKPTLTTIDSLGKMGLCVPKIDFIQQLQRKEVSIFDGHRITRALADADVLLEDREAGWVVNHEWWSDRQRMRTAEESGMLRIHAG